MMNEHVVLVDEQNNRLGLEDKYKVHTADTPLHRGFSLFIINKQGELLLQQRSDSKIAWPGVWSNSVCGHPADGETPQEAAKRRAKFELGIDIELDSIYLILPKYQYKFEYNGIVENEICPVMAVFGEFEPKPNPDEVKDTRWIEWPKFMEEIKKPNKYSQWCQQEAALISTSEVFTSIFEAYCFIPK